MDTLQRFLTITAIIEELEDYGRYSLSPLEGARLKT